MSRTYTTQFLCDYDMRLYPFDTQTCHMNFILDIIGNEFVYLSVDFLDYIGPLDLTQYFVRDKTMHVADISNSRGVQVSFVFGRKLLSVMLTIYLPTVMLNIMGHITVYFKPFFFEAVITVNLTVMLVLTTM